MNVIEMPVGELKEYENNPRKNDAAVEKVASSIGEFGFRNPILVDKDNVIIAGHTRLKAAKRLGMATVPVIRVEDLTPQQVRAFRLADNKVAEAAEWDLDLLDIELNAVMDDFFMEEFGFDLTMFPPEQPPAEKQQKEVEFRDTISVVVTCRDNDDAEELYRRLTAEGRKCRISTL